MAAASFVQTSFLGGEWSQFFQGRMDLPKYHTALNVCLNSYPIEEGCLVRRQGFRFAAHTRLGRQGRLLPFTFTEASPYNMEFTDGYLRFFNGAQLVYEPTITDLVAITPDSAGIFMTGTTTWAVGDTVIFLFNSVADSADAAVLRNRQFTVHTKPTGETFTLADPISGAVISGVGIGFIPERDSLQVAKVLEFVTPWTGTLWNQLRTAQSSDLAVLLTGSTIPQKLTVTTAPTATSFAAFTLGPMDFSQGPFLDPVQDSIATPSGTSGSITIDFTFPAYASGTYYWLGQRVTSGGAAYQSLAQANIGNTPASSPTFWKVIDGGLAFSDVGGATATDVGRSIRLWNEPATWDSGTSYATGDLVTFGAGFGTRGAQYQAQAASTNVAPNTSIAKWAPISGIAFWTQGVITAVNSATNVTFAFMGGPLSFSQATTLWRLGSYTATGPAWPTCGTYMEGRVWLGGAVPNRLDASVPNKLQVTGVTDFSFLPTNPDGTVVDANAIDYTLQSTETSPIKWMIPTQQGLAVGTLADEWLVSASALNDPLTPSSIQARPVSKYGSAAIEPKRTGLSVVFVHKYQRRLLEMISDVFSGKFSAPNLSISAKHLTVGGLDEIAHQEELAPIVWGRTGEGALIGVTYRRVSAFSTEEPTYAGWHRHELGSGRTTESVCVGPNIGGTLDSLAIITASGQEPRHVEIMTDLFDEENSIYDAWFLDDAVTPAGSDIVTYGGQSYVRFYGLWHLNGKTVTVWAGALDCGDYPVAGGSVDVPLGAAGGLFTQSYLTTLSNSGIDFGGLACAVDQFATVTPPVGTSTGTIQILAPPGSFSTLPVIPDWANNAVIISNDGTTSAAGFWKINIGTGATMVSTDAVTLGLAGEFVIHPFALSGGSVIWCSGSGSTGTYRKMDKNTFALTGTSGSAYSKPYSLAGTAVGSANFCVLSGIQASTVRVLNTDTMTSFAGPFAPSMPGIGGGAVTWVELAQGPVGANASVVYGIGHPDGFAGASFSQPLPVYAVSINATSATMAARGTVAPAAIDPTWTTFAQAYAGFGIWYDPSDGNIIISVGTLDSGVTHSYYLAKVRTADAAVLWTFPVTAVTQGNNLSLVRGGTMIYNIGGTVYNINTATGAAASYSIPGLTAATGQAFNANTGTLVTYATSFVGTTSGAPVPQNSTPITFSGYWSTITLNSSFQGNSYHNTRLSVPVVIGYTYASRGQLLRPAAKDESGAQNGPAFGKKRRSHQFAAFMHNTQGISFGTDFTHLNPAQFRTAGGTPYPLTQLYSGVLWDTISDDYSFEGQLCWEVTRPYPATIMAIGGFIHTQDK